MVKDMTPLLQVQDLFIQYNTDNGIVKAVNGASFHIDRGETLGLVGETGAGKTTSALGILRLVPDPPGKIMSGSIKLSNADLLSLSEHEMQKIRGKKVSMIFQDPMTALNPVLTIGDQVVEVIRLHEKISREEAHQKAADMLEMVGIPYDRFDEYPHQFSGGMKQRVVIAIALACQPELLIADEPTTALDVTIQAQVLDLINRLKKQLGTSVLLITHDLGVVAEVCDRVAIMYAGQIIEQGTLRQVYYRTGHPYTKGLFASIPSIDRKSARLTLIPGLMPDPTHLGNGCAFYPRCKCHSETCLHALPPEKALEPGHTVRCWLYVR